MDEPKKPRRRNKMATLELKDAVLNLNTEEKARKFFEYVNSPNPANDKIRKMIKESSPIPRRKK